MISILIDFWQLKLFQFRFESILSKINFSISVLSSSIFDFRALIFIAFLCDKFFRNFEKNLIFFIKIFLKNLYPQNSQIMDNFLGFEAIFEEFRAIFSTKMMYLYHFTNEIIESSINRDFQVRFQFHWILEKWIFLDFESLRFQRMIKYRFFFEFDSEKIVQNRRFFDFG